VSQFVPSIGTYLAGALPVLIALFHDPVDALWVLVFITLYQQFENLVLSPGSRHAPCRRTRPSPSGR
jgi:predicted PurR-regulated permease PerM